MFKRDVIHRLLAIGLLPTALCWMELLYRVHLYRQYGSRPFLNHVDESYFVLMYGAGAVSALIPIVGLILAIQGRSFVRTVLFATAFGCALSYVAALRYMNHHDMLVTYEEFARNTGP